MSGDEYKKCPFCGKEIKKMAVKCKHCHAFIEESSNNLHLDNHNPGYTEHIAQGKGFFASLFDVSMKEMITPRIIRFIYVIGLVAIGIGALGAIIGAIFSGVGSFLGTLIGAPLGALVAVIFLRIYMELIILLFNIYEQLKEIRKGLR